MPTLRVQGKELKISEISEQGMRVITRDTTLFQIGDVIKGEVLLNSMDHNIAIEGKVLRIVGNEVICHLREGLSFKDMIAEQRYLRKYYPTVLPKGAKEV